MPGGGALPLLELCGFLDVFDSNATAHQYGGVRVPFALPVAFLVCARGPIFTKDLTNVAWPNTAYLSNPL